MPKCRKCQNVKAAYQMITAFRCLDCHRAVNREMQARFAERRRAALKAAGLYRPPPTPWTEDELERLAEACQRRMTYEDAAAYVGGGRTAKACRSMAANRFLRGLRSGRPRPAGRPKWTEEQVAAVRAASVQFGPREAARRLSLTPGQVSGILRRDALAHSAFPDGPDNGKVSS